MQKKHIYILIFAILINVIISGITTVNAAIVSVNPSLSAVTAGNIVTTNIVVNTEGSAINSADAQLIFPADLLEVVSIDKSGSIFSLWVEGPTYSNALGNISFSGGIPNPGYNGSNGKIISVVFKAKKAGTASLAFSNANVLANDGTGTNVAKATVPATLSISIPSPSTEIVNNVNTTIKLPSIPVVSSQTHPDSETWYSVDKVRFDWDVPKGVTEVQTFLSRSSNAVPTISRDGTFSAVTVNDIQDGVLYFHIRFRNVAGWGPILHRKIQTDSTPPVEFTPTITDDGKYAYVTLNAKDIHSGIGHYEITIDDGESYKISPESLIDNKYRLPVVDGGPHNIKIEAYDNAGNERAVNLTYSSPSIEAPKITNVPQSIVMNQTLQVVGTSVYPETQVNISLQIEGGEIMTLKTVTDSDGNFRLLINDKVECELTSCVIDQSGVATIWANMIFDTGAQSPSSEKVSTIIENTSWVKFVYNSVKTLSLTIPLFAIIIVLLLLVYIGWHRFFGLKRKIHKDARDTIQDIHRAMSLYKEELYVQLKALEKIKLDRDLNRKEEKIFKELENNIDNIERFIDKRLKRY